MEEVTAENDGASWWVKWNRPSLILAGVTTSVLQPIILLLSGKDINDAIWPHAFRTLQVTLWLRENVTLMLSLIHI